MSAVEDSLLENPDFVQAQIEKAQAEAEEAKSNAQKAQAEARKAEAEAKDIEYDNTRRSLDEEAFNARDERNHLYRFNESVTASSVSKCIAKLTEWHRITEDCPIEIVFNSPGGSVIEGMALFDFIQELRKTHFVTTGSIGMAASMGGVLLQAGEKRWCGENAWILIHRIQSGAIGAAYEIEDELAFIKRLEQRLIQIFTKRSTLTVQKIKKNWERKDWWIDADQALELGLVDEIHGKLV